MATIDPIIDMSIKHHGTPVPRVIWAGVTSADTLTPLTLARQYGLAAGVQAVGTFGGTSVGVSVSNTGETDEWAVANDIAGSPVALTAATDYAEVSLSAVYLLPVLTGGTGYTVDIVVALRGPYSL